MIKVHCLQWVLGLVSFREIISNKIALKVTKQSTKYQFAVNAWEGDYINSMAFKEIGMDTLV